jgi:hypothetical protein
MSNHLGEVGVLVVHPRAVHDGGVTLGGTTYAYFAEGRWGAATPERPRPTSDQTVERDETERQGARRDGERSRLERHDVAA